MIRRHTSLRLWFLAMLLAVVGGSFVACLQPESLVGVAGPEDIVRFEVRRGSGEVLWRIEAEEPTTVPEISYGEVPLGFRQTFPAAGQAPRPFEFYEALELETTTTQRGFLHWGHASGPSRMDIATSRTWLLEAPGERDAGEEEEAPVIEEPAEGQT